MSEPNSFTFLNRRAEVRFEVGTLESIVGLAHSDELSRHIVQMTAGLIFEIIPADGLVADPAIVADRAVLTIVDRIVIAQLSELPEHFLPARQKRWC